MLSPDRGSSFKADVYFPFFCFRLLKRHASPHKGTARPEDDVSLKLSCLIYNVKPARIFRWHEFADIK